MPTSEYKPSVQDVANGIKGRAKTPYGAEVGNFDDTTTITGSEVSGLIDEAVDEIAAAVGPDIPDGPDPDDPDTLRRMAKRVVENLTRAGIELAFFPEQAAQSGSAYNQFKERAKETKKALIEAVAEAGSGGAGESVAGSEPSGGGSFPAASGWDEVRW